MLFSCRRIKKKTLAILYCTSINISLGWSWLQLGIITLIFSTLDKYHIISSNFIGRESKKHLLLSLSSKELPILKKKNQNSTSLIISTQNILVRSTMELIWSNCTTLMLFWSKLLHLGKLLRLGVVLPKLLHHGVVLTQFWLKQRYLGGVTLYKIVLRRGTESYFGQKIIGGALFW